MSTWEKYSGGAARWTEDAYSDPRAYLARRAEHVRTLGPVLEAGDVVLDLACGDGGLAEFLPEQRYIGVDASPEMVEAGRSRGREIRVGDLNDYEPTETVDATTIFRAIYYASDRPALFRRIARYTEKKLVFDLNPRQYRLADLRAELRAAGFSRLDVQPFFVPQTHVLPAPVAFALRGLEHGGPLARLLLRVRFTLLCAASHARSR